MGLTKVTLEITNPEDKSQRLKEEFLVDSGAFYTVLPKRIVDKLNIKPSYQQEFGLADGTKISRDIGSAYVSFEGRRVASPVILGKARDNALMGVLTLEALGLILNPFERKIHPAKLAL
ncbi:MAG: clan AA aspartic protease [Patescibacteria group bacterium]